jgi:hypothetical protein
MGTVEAKFRQSAPELTDNMMMMSGEIDHRPRRDRAQKADDLKSQPTGDAGNVAA